MPPNPQQREHGLEALTVRELRAIAQREHVDVRGLRTKREVLEMLRAEGLRHLQFRKITEHPPRDASLPDPENHWSLLEYMARWEPEEIHKLVHFPPEHRDAIAASVRILQGNGYVWNIDDGSFMLTEAGWQRGHALHLQRLAEQQADRPHLDVADA